MLNDSNVSIRSERHGKEITHRVNIERKILDYRRIQEDGRRTGKETIEHEARIEWINLRSKNPEIHEAIRRCWSARPRTVCEVHGATDTRFWRRSWRQTCVARKHHKQRENRQQSSHMRAQKVAIHHLKCNEVARFNADRDSYCRNVSDYRRKSLFIYKDETSFL